LPGVAELPGGEPPVSRRDLHNPFDGQAFMMHDAQDSELNNCRRETNTL
jgi:hypothetical protein